MNKNEEKIMGRRMHVWPVRLASPRPVQRTQEGVLISLVVKDGTRPLVLKLQVGSARQFAQSVLDAAAESAAETNEE
jgi:hypothetical protein